MFARLLPREADFFNYFDQHAQLIVKVAEEFHAMVSADVWTFSKSTVIKDLEHEADKVTHDCMESLHKTFITPIDREDVYRLISSMDDIIDCIDEAFERIVIYKLTSMNAEVKNLAVILVNSAKEVQCGVNGLRNISDLDNIKPSCIRINALENEADTVYRNAIAKLFDEEQDTRNVIKWKEVYESLERATDFCEDVADVIQSIILEQG